MYFQSDFFFSFVEHKHVLKNVGNQGMLVIPLYRQNNTDFSPNIMFHIKNKVFFGTMIK